MTYWITGLIAELLFIIVFHAYFQKKERKCHPKTMFENFAKPNLSCDSLLIKSLFSPADRNEVTEQKSGLKITSSSH